MMIVTNGMTIQIKRMIEQDIKNGLTVIVIYPKSDPIR